MRTNLDTVHGLLHGDPLSRKRNLAEDGTPPAWAVDASQSLMTSVPPWPMMPFKNPLYDSVVGQLWPAAMVEARRVQV